jgi:hypothetical protein
MAKRRPCLCGAVLLLILSGMLGASYQLMAQQAGQGDPPAATEAPPASPQTPLVAPQIPTKPATNSGAAPSPSAPDPNVPQNDRILWTLPNYLTVENASSMPPLTVRQKFKLAALETFDPVEFGFVGLAAAVNQATGANPTYGPGLKGYGRRYALEFGDNTVENSMVDALFPSALRQDPRYYQLGKGSFLHRAGYAATRAVVTRSDSGKAQFNFSEILGAATAAGLSNCYHPTPRALGSAINIWYTEIGWDVVSFEMKEFWPDVHHFLTHGNH